MRWTFKTLAALAIAVFGTGNANAVPIVSVVPSSSSVVLGSVFNVDVIVSELNDELIGAYDFTLSWDPTLLSLPGGSFDKFLDGPNSIVGVHIGFGSLNISEVSLGTLANQIGLSTFRLFSLNMLALSVGSAAIEFASGPQILSNELGEPYEGWVARNAVVEITREPAPTPVPEPGPLALLACGLFMLVFMRSRRATREPRG